MGAHEEAAREDSSGPSLERWALRCQEGVPCSVAGCPGLHFQGQVGGSLLEGRRAMPAAAGLNVPPQLETLQGDAECQGPLKPTCWPRPWRPGPGSGSLGPLAGGVPWRVGKVGAQLCSRPGARQSR